MPGVGGLKTAVTGRWQRLRRKHAWVDHVAGAYAHYKSENGDHLAAAITYFSFLALFPLVLLGVSVAAFVLAASPHLRDELLDNISRQAPGGLGNTLATAVTTAIHQRAAVGIVGLVGVAFSGLGWIDNLRTAIDAIWGRAVPKQSFLAKKAADVVILLGLGLGTVVSLGITAGGTAATHQVLVWVHADGIPAMGTLTRVLALALAILGSTLIFGWVMIRLPDAPVSRRTAIKASLLAAVGFEILKLVGTAYIARVTKSPAASVIGPALGILVWINLVSRYLLFCVAWAATARDSEIADDRDTAPVAGPPVPPDRGRVPNWWPAGVAAGLFSAGATLGAAAVAARRGRRTRAR